LSVFYDEVKNWLANSGIVISDKNHNEYGAVYSHFNKKEAKYGYLYPEITGYTSSAFSFLAKVEKSDNFSEMSLKSSQWIMKIFDKYDCIVQGLGDKSRSRENIAYSFDTAICAKGLLDSYSVTKDTTLLDYSKKLVQWLSGAVEEDGRLKPYFNRETRQFEESDEIWYKKYGCFHIKVVIPFLQLYKLTKEEDLLQYAIKICNNYTRFQKSDGSFLLHDNTCKINLHAHCYALEGLLFAFNITKNEEYLKSCEKATQWCINKIEEDGSVNLWFNSKEKSKAVYAVAQLIRLMILIDKYHDTNDTKPHIDKIYSFMISLQAKDDDIRIRGGFYEELYKSVFGWKRREKLNSWGSLFALQALFWFDNYNKITFEESIPLLY
jgi:uncharacterized protein YyaL (SSP411 family)